MRVPETPTPYLELLSKAGSRKLGEILQRTDTLPRDRYLHWNELRRRPSPKGLSHEDWWLLLKMRRVPQMRRVPLPDKTKQTFAFALPDSLLELLHQIDCGLGSPWGLPDVVTNPATRNEYVVSTLMQESITSSQLEGAATTREVAKDMLRTGRAPRDSGERMILNNYLTMQRIMDVRDEPMSPELVFELHRRVTDGTLKTTDAAGRFRRSDEQVCVVDMENTVYHEPPPATELPKRLEAMCAFANAQTPEFFIHPVVRAIILHFWLAYDHPFVDGNGRTARALFYWCMLHQKFRLFEFISISQIILQAPSQYALAFLHTETDDNDLTYFLLHQAEVIRRAVKALHDYVEHKKLALHSTEKALRGIDGLNHRQQALLAHALRDAEARYTIEGHRHSHGVVYQTARMDLLDLAERGLLLAGKKGKAMVFRIPGDLNDKLAKQGAKPLRVGENDLDRTLPLKLPFRSADED
jgi:Fic family protein